jgi:DNA-damage-inducible protein D
MKKEEILAQFKSYEDVVCTIDNTECRSARELQKQLGYSLWQKFNNVINKAKEACINVGNNIDDHFIDVNNMVEVGSGAKCLVNDVMLTRYACYLKC